MQRALLTSPFRGPYDWIRAAGNKPRVTTSAKLQPGGWQGNRYFLDIGPPKSSMRGVTLEAIGRAFAMPPAIMARGMLRRRTLPHLSFFGAEADAAGRPTYKLYLGNSHFLDSSTSPGVRRTLACCIGWRPGSRRAQIKDYTDVVLDAALAQAIVDRLAHAGRPRLAGALKSLLDRSKTIGSLWVVEHGSARWSIDFGIAIRDAAACEQILVDVAHAQQIRDPHCYAWIRRAAADGVRRMAWGMDGRAKAFVTVYRRPQSLHPDLRDLQR